MLAWGGGFGLLGWMYLLTVVLCARVGIEGVITVNTVWLSFSVGKREDTLLDFVKENC
jgi:hypothetical protein